MGQSTEELRADIEQSRDNLTRDLDAIGDRVSPRRMVERRWGRARRWMTQARERVFGAAEDLGSTAADKVRSAGDAVTAAPDMARERARGNPMMAGALAFGAGFLLAVMFAPSDTEEELVEKAADKVGGVEPLKEELTGAVSEIGSTAEAAGKQAMASVKQEASQHAGELKDEAKGKAAEVKESAR